MKLALRHCSIFLMLLLGLSACSVSKFIPEGHYLLDAVKIESDNKEVKPSEMRAYVRQTSNAKWFSLVKIPMYIYSAAGRDSTKWINRLLYRMGDAPRIYDPELTEETREQMEQAVRNMGYMGAQVGAVEVRKGNRLKVHYVIRAGEPYTVGSVAYDIDDYRIAEYLRADSVHRMLAPGMRFDVNVLDQERQRITQYLQNRGYFRFNKDFITYQADTTLYSKQVGLTLKLAPYRRKKEDTPAPHKQYHIRDVNFIFDSDFSDLSTTGLAGLDSVRSGGVNFYYKDKLYLRPRVITDYNRLQTGDLYRLRNVQSTYNALGRLNILKYSNIRFEEDVKSDSACLDAFVTLSRNKNKSVAFEIEGTNSAGDLGAAASVSYMHRNLFKGSETFSIKIRGAYEAITGLEGYANSNYMEYAVEAGLNFPEFMFPFLSSDFKRRIRATSEVTVKYNWQIRPEFERTVASAAWSYKWSKRRASHRFDVFDLNYIYMPYRSETFRSYLDEMDQRNPLLRYSYEDLFIVRMGYTYTYNSSGAASMKTAQRNSYSIRFNIEESGNLLYAFSKIVNRHPKNGEAFQMGNIDFAQYVKMDIDYAKNFMIDYRNSLVFHVGVGVAVPYGNSKSLPFEKLYFSGGANSVRGWSVRSLGPGGYRGDANSLDYVNHTGDIKLDLNLEYRTHLFWKLNGAAFIDAGNVWTIRSRDMQPEGQFKFDRFYKQLAVAYGLGIRFDLDFLILRFDGGMKAVNPMYTGKDRYPIVSPDFKRDFTFHFAVGYPF
ncbi:BamA/TamA family outer membrane protein [Bacteroides gallinaceum]|uniref:BamA/TamA family outer membrane protein n=2 Tax=Bacteroidaceae TaxID=815 RepID=A0ABT7VFQ1_9BACE|nr:BamA/TamA family outer membrane protein [Bacteroides gallinaceum]MBU3856245.1 BamA/TamA family outer membrane protein [Candidatus Phocaeicola excrementipullorum]MDM8325129.1 BamA/TamA family outer membrane protein [Bacteroides gallinaceum]